MNLHKKKHCHMKTPFDRRNSNNDKSNQIIKSKDQRDVHEAFPLFSVTVGHFNKLYCYKTAKRENLFASSAVCCLCKLYYDIFHATLARLALFRDHVGRIKNFFKGKGQAFSLNNVLRLFYNILQGIKRKMTTNEIY